MAAETNRLRSYGRAQQVRERVEDGYHQAEDLVRDYPASSVLTTLALGFAVGYLATSLLTPPPRRRVSWAEANLPEGLGRQISDAVMRVLPESVTRRM
jgi:hypothetical protein